MAAPTPLKSHPVDSAAPESPTTARPLEMDDDDLQDAGVLGADDAATTKPATTATPATTNAPAPVPAPEDVAPPKPPRPVSETQNNQQMLQEAFPTIDLAVIKAVLSASRGQVEPAFNALLEMTDPDAVQNDVPPPPPPPRPTAEPVGPTSTAQSQLEADEEYARRLAEHYENVGAYEARTANNRGPGAMRGRQQTGLSPNEADDDREHSFLDDDLPVIKESLRKGFVETQSKVNTWFTQLKKKLDEQFDEDDDARQGQGGSSFMGRPTRDQTRRSADYDRYDADPELLSDDFAGMKFNSDGTPVNNRGHGNPNLFKPPPPSKSPRPNDGRRVAFAETVEDIEDTYNASPKLPPKDTPPSSGKASKWQPLSAVEPSPIAENDPFSLGDSDDERDAKDKKEIKLEDKDEVLRKATADAMSDSLVDNKPKSSGAADK